MLVDNLGFRGRHDTPWKQPNSFTLLFKEKKEQIEHSGRITFVDFHHPSSIRDAKIAASERVKSGVTEEQLWLQINEPTEKDKGKYTLDLFDGQDGVKRVFDLSGQGERSQTYGNLGSINPDSTCNILTSIIMRCLFLPLQHGKTLLRNSRGSST